MASDNEDPALGQKGNLSEKDFIHEEYGRNPFPFWGWLTAVIGFSLLFSWALTQYTDLLSKQYIDSPFLKVTNREMSLFLWQYPEHMRANVKNKGSYLPAFQYVEKIGLNPEYADDYVSAPPELLFLYHTWHRLLSANFPLRVIPIVDFKIFISDAEEWQPHFWKNAPLGYINLIENLNSQNISDLNTLSKEVLPLEVRQAFIGWKNYFYEGEKINQLEVTYAKLDSFLKLYPHYARNYWLNIIGKNYLKTSEMKIDTAIVPAVDMAPFLKVAVYNWMME